MAPRAELCDDDTGDIFGMCVRDDEDHALDCPGSGVSVFVAVRVGVGRYLRGEHISI